MIIQYASDLHLEMPLNNAYMKKNPLQKQGEILILAGDINYLRNKQKGMDSFYEAWSKEFEQIFIIPGNHEFYGKHYPIQNIFPSLKKKMRDNIYYINNHVEIIDEARFIFTVLFSEISQEQSSLIKRFLNDFHISRYNHDSNLSLTIKEYNKCHIKSRVFLEEALSKPFKGRTIVVSHHVPYPKTFIKGYPKFSYDLSEAFHVDLTWLMKKYKVDHWISGHTHFNHSSIEIEGTMFHTNQLGYIESQEHKNFNNHATIRL